MRILVIEDAQLLRESLEQGLGEAGFEVSSAADGRAGLALARQHPFDLIVLDLNLPGLDGLDVLAQLRRAQTAAFVLILTARDTHRDRATGLNAGADDYLIKPFAFPELLARIRTLLRRREAHDPVLRVGDLEIHTAARTVRRAGQAVELSAREYALLELLASHAGQVVTRAQIWRHVYDANSSADSNVVDVFIGLLRKKIERAGCAKLLHTRRGQGYLLADLSEGGDEP